MSNSTYIFIESLRTTYEAGGVVMLPILLCGVIGFYFLYSGWFRIGGDFFRKDVGRVVKHLRRDLMETGVTQSGTLKISTAQSGAVHSGAKAATCATNASGDSVQVALKNLARRSGILARELRYALEIACDNPSLYREYMQVRMIKTVRYMEQGNHIVSVMATAAPLLGLLGTVTGMVSTFDVITLYGNQNPVLMADGISEALISTQSGLLVAFPLTLLKQRLDERIELLRGQMELGATIIENFISKD